MKSQTVTPPPVITPDRLEVWVPGKLVNPLNAREHHMAKAKRVQRERELTALVVWAALRGRELIGRVLPPRTDETWHVTPASHLWCVTDRQAPKAITLTLHTPRAWDDDALPAGVKAHRDGLVDAWVVQGDAPKDGHAWTYRQVVTRAWAGVQIAVTRRDGAAGAAGGVPGGTR